MTSTALVKEFTSRGLLQAMSVHRRTGRSDLACEPRWSGPALPVGLGIGVEGVSSSGSERVLSAPVPALTFGPPLTRSVWYRIRTCGHRMRSPALSCLCVPRGAVSSLSIRSPLSIRVKGCRPVPCQYGTAEHNRSTQRPLAASDGTSRGPRGPGAASGHMVKSDRKHCCSSPTVRTRTGTSLLLESSCEPVHPGREDPNQGLG
ncbi:DUF6177 family protein [Nocardiopsis sp. Huas11]|uniref:DUF6177 family protein n=1 Tax=Nocardiopsis sp. Huas11 TaxID=2183912 RepID=UPI003517E5E9